MKNTNVIKLPLYKGYKTYWGAYCTDSKGKPFYIFLKNGQEFNIENMNAVIHENGIEFLEGIEQ